jgi:GntR family transcriptional regulator/MocR family aminotransferase
VSSVYRERHRLLTGILATDFARHLDVIPCECGFHVAAIATKANADEIRAVVRRALKKGVAVQVLSSFTPGNSKPTGLLLGYGAIATNNIEEGLRRLKSCF